MRKFIFPVILIALTLIGVVWFFVANRNESYSENDAFQAIPAKTPLIIEVPGLKTLIKTLKSDNPVLVELRSVAEFQTFWNEISELESLLTENEQLKRAVGNKSMLVALSPEGKNQVGSLLVMSLRSKSEKSNLIDFFEDLARNHSGTLTKRVYDHTTVYQFRSGKNEFHFAEEKGIFLFSRYTLLVEEAIRQLSVETLLDQEQFRNLYNTVSSSSDFNLFINHKRITQLLDQLVAPDFRKTLNQFSNFADWTELDVKLNKSDLLLSGFSVSDPINDNYLNIFRKQEAGRFTIDEVLSSNISLFLNFSLTDFNRFQDDFEEYLKKQGSYYTRETRLKELERYSKTPFLPMFKEFAGGEYAIAFGQVTQNEPASNRFFIASVKGQSIAREKLVPMLENYARAQNKTLQQMQSNYQIQNDLNFIIYEFPFANLPELIFGQAFAAAETRYLCFYDNYLIFADNAAALRNYLHDLVLSSTLKKDQYFQKFSQQMTSRSSVCFYLNFSRAFHLKNYYLRKETGAAVQNNEQATRKFYAFSWQFAPNSGEFLNNIYLKYDPVLKEEPQTVWKSKLDSTIAIKPQLVDNHNDLRNKEVIVQDNKNNLYLINKEGVIVWKIRLSDKIMGNVHQVDYFRNGKLQYLFNTKEKLYLIDRNGNNVAKFPVVFRSPASNGVAVFDYDNNRNYRFFVASESKQLLCYDREGKTVTGWNPEKTDGLVENPMQHFRVDGKDYLVCADKHKTYIFDRQGNIRVKTSDNFEHSGNNIYLANGNTPALVTTDIKGLVRLQYFDGKSATRNLGSFGKNHYFEAEDLTGNGKTDFVIADDNKLSAYTDQGKKLFDRKFNAPISGKPNIYTFASNNKKIGVVCADENRVYLVSTNGDLYDGFPLQGNTDFSIGFLSKGNPYFNLLVGNDDNSFFNYKVE